jgi:hypothetical protein
VLDDDLRALLESGSSTIVGLLTAEGDPFATRGWGTKVSSGKPLRLRTLVAAGAFVSAGRWPFDGTRFAIAVTGADVLTLQSVQAKGTAVGLERPTAGDLERSARFCDEFFGAVEEVDGIARDLMDRLVPVDLLACTVEVDELYDQTPGPGAGARLER